MTVRGLPSVDAFILERRVLTPVGSSTFGAIVSIMELGWRQGGVVVLCYVMVGVGDVIAFRQAKKVEKM